MAEEGWNGECYDRVGVFVAKAVVVVIVVGDTLAGLVDAFHREDALEKGRGEGVVQGMEKGMRAEGYSLYGIGGGMKGSGH